MSVKIATSKQEQETLKTLIKMYRKMPYLWKRDDQNYTNRERREEGYNILLNIYQNWDEDVTMKELKKKIDNLRSNYNKEFKKVLMAKEENKVYVPTLWYFKLLSFLHNGKGDSGDLDASLHESEDPLENASTSDIEETVVKVEPGRFRKRKLRRLHESRQHPPDFARKPPMNFQRNESWEITYGKSVGHQVKDLKPDQLVICQKLISDVIFCAKLDKLNEHSQVLNPEIGPTFLEHNFDNSD